MNDLGHNCIHPGMMKPKTFWFFDFATWFKLLQANHMLKQSETNGQNSRSDPWPGQTVRHFRPISWTAFFRLSTQEPAKWKQLWNSIPKFLFFLFWWFQDVSNHETLNINSNILSSTNKFWKLPAEKRPFCWAGLQIKDKSHDDTASCSSEVAWFHWSWVDHKPWMWGT